MTTATPSADWLCQALLFGCAAKDELTILAYEMNGAPVSVLHGAPLRLRCENELGFKMVKWIATIEFVHDFADLVAGQGGYNEDHEFFGYRTPI